VSAVQQKGEIVFDLGPSKENPRNGEGSFLGLSDGRIMFAYSSFVGETNRDTAYARIVIRYSHDSGNTWSGERVIVSPQDHEALNVMSVSLLRLGNGDIGLFYLVRKGWHDMRLHMRRSSDEGETWGEAVCCVPAPGYYVTNNDRVIRLSNGRLVFAASFHKMWGHKVTYNGRGVVCCFLSDDDGDTWWEARTPLTMPEPRSTTGLQEPGVIERKDGTLWLWSRTDLGLQYESFSLDGGETWTKPSASEFTSPASPLSMKRNPYDDRLLAVWNPVPNYRTRPFLPRYAGRTPLIGAISNDDGKTWGHDFAAEPLDDMTGFCYAAIHFTADSVLLGYYGHEIGDGEHRDRLLIRKVNWSEIVQNEQG